MQKKGFKVTVYDHQGIAQGCSYANAGHFATEQIFPLAEQSLLWQLPKLLIDPLGPIALSPRYFLKALPWFLRFISNAKKSNRAHNTAALKQLNQLAIEAYKPLLAEANASHLLTTKGSLLVFESTPLKKIMKIKQAFIDENIAVQLLERNAIKQLEPNIQQNIQYALYFTEVGHSIDPLQLCIALASFAKQLGVHFEQQQITSITQVNHEHRITFSEQGNIQVKHLVIAAGAWSKMLLKPLGYHVPIEAERGYSLTLGNSTGLNRPVASAERKFIITPMAAGLRFSGTVEFSGLTAKENEKRADILLQHGQKIINGLTSQIEQSQATQYKWAGYRPSLPDSLPVIGEAPNHRGLYFAFGHQHLGLTQGAITGNLIAQLLAKEPTSIDLSPFSINRFSGN